MYTGSVHIWDQLIKTTTQQQYLCSHLCSQHCTCISSKTQHLCTQHSLNPNIDILHIPVTDRKLTRYNKQKNLNHFCEPFTRLASNLLNAHAQKKASNWPDEQICLLPVRFTRLSVIYKISEKANLTHITEALKIHL